MVIMRDRVETGIPELDSMLGGGLIDKSLYILILNNGVEGRVLVRQILYNHILKGGKVAYYILESSAEDIVESMNFYGWRIDEQVKRGSWVFITVHHPVFRGVLKDFPERIGEELEVSNLKQLANDLSSRISRGFWCFTEFSLPAAECELSELAGFVVYLQRAARLYGGVHILEVAAKLVDESKLSLLRHLADCVFEVSTEETELEPRGVLVVRKLGDVPYSVKRIHFSVRNYGIIVHTFQRVT